jgi:FtsP/CotA-like multicopper oxidase with cupredoxin domain
MSSDRPHWSRRRFLRRATHTAAFAASQCLLPVPLWAASNRRSIESTPYHDTHELLIGHTEVIINGRRAAATGINGTVPGPLIRLREGQRVTLNVRNALAEDSSIHWHGLLLPADMDGVPGISFAGIPPGESYRYEYDVIQNGTYWYHSHSGFQEQTGVYGPMIIDPAEDDPVEFDREFVVLLSDWTFENPAAVMANLKKSEGYYNPQRRTAGDFFSDVQRMGFRAATADRRMWGRMRMTPTDIADVSGTTYTYLMNGRDPAANWTALFHPGERVRLRFINGSAMSFFNVRIPELEMLVVQADGQNIAPLEVDEFQIGVAETYDVIVNTTADRAYTIFAEAMDRSGFACGTLAPRPGMSAEVPSLRERPLLTMTDMGMAHGDDMGHAGHRPGSTTVLRHEHPTGPGVDNVIEHALDRLDHPGIGLENLDHRVLRYGDLRSLGPNSDRRKPGRSLELHLTGNMERYMWSFDGVKFSEVHGPIEFIYGERLRLILVNDTMMAHPIHLHGMFVELINGNGTHNPRKHTVSLKPAERLAVDLTVDAPGDWAFHCHLLYHMQAGMMRAVAVRRGAGNR